MVEVFWADKNGKKFGKLIAINEIVRLQKTNSRFLRFLKSIRICSKIQILLLCVILTILFGSLSNYIDQIQVRKNKLIFKSL
jgi:hypothetical protein